MLDPRQRLPRPVQLSLLGAMVPLDLLAARDSLAVGGGLLLCTSGLAASLLISARRSEAAPSPETQTSETPESSSAYKRGHHFARRTSRPRDAASASQADTRAEVPPPPKPGDTLATRMSAHRQRGHQLALAIVQSPFAAEMLVASNLLDRVQRIAADEEDTVLLGDHRVAVLLVGDAAIDAASFVERLGLALTGRPIESNGVPIPAPEVLVYPLRRRGDPTEVLRAAKIPSTLAFTFERDSARSTNADGFDLRRRILEGSSTARKPRSISLGLA